MSTKLLKKLFCCLIIPILLFVSTEKSYAMGEDRKDSTYRVLFISSYAYSWGSIPYQIEGLRESLGEEGFVLHYEFMDTKNTSYSENYREFYDLIRYKLSQRETYDGIIVGDDAALNFAMAYREELFKDIPIVFQGIDDINNAFTAIESPMVTGLIERVDYLANLKFAQSLFPGAENLILIHDNLENGLGIWKQLNQDKMFFSNYNVEFLNTSTYTKEELCSKLSEYDGRDIIFGSSMGEEKGGTIYPEEERYRIVREFTNVPVFRFTQAGVGEGMLGGYIIDHRASGRMAADMMKEILVRGTIPPVVTKTPSTFYFDYNVLMKYNVGMNKIPKEAIIINQPDTFLERYAVSLISSLFGVILLLTIGLGIRLESNRILRSSYDKIQGAEAELKRQYHHNQEYTRQLEEKERDIRHQAEHDFLTDLPNRRYAAKRINELQDQGMDHSVIIVDIDDFKEINETYGHEYGDAVIVQQAERLKQIADKHGFYLSRFGGDEFLIIIQDEDKKKNRLILNEISDALSQTIELEVADLNVRSSMGIASFNKDGGKSEDIISNANLALFEAKGLGKNSYRFYNASLRADLLKLKLIEKILDDACEQDGFYLLYHPQVDSQTGEIMALEAILRLKDYTIPANEFIQIAEKTDLILRIGRIVTEKAVNQIVQWREAGLPQHKVSINFSSKQLRDEGYVNFLKTLIEKNRIQPDLIEIEITESIFLKNDKKAKKLLEDFLDIGVSIALDDFGTGYSSINYLTYIPVTKIKLDKSIVDSFLTEHKSAFIENIIRLAHSLGLTITVEGVETLEQWEKLKEYKCDYIQGYLFSKPLEGDEIGQIGKKLEAKEK